MTQLNEVSPPGWGHTKAEKEKTKPNKPKSKIGGSAHEFDKDLKSGKFKGLPGDKTMKDKKARMFKLMWSMKNKGDKTHYKPGVKNKLKAKYKEKNEMIDAKKIRNYKNVSNATVEKANKDAEKVKDKEQKGTLQFPEMPQENLSLAPKGKGKKAAKALYKENEVTHFGDILRQAIEEAKKVDAIKEINKIVKTKTMGKLHGQKVDLFTASAIQQVYKAINHKNKEKMNSVMSKDIHGLLKMADFSMSKMNR